MAERYVPRKMSAGVILVDSEGRVLLQHRDDNPAIMFPNCWGIVGGAALEGETPEEAARREAHEETGLHLERFEPFRAYYFNERPGNGRASRKTSDYELYLFHAPCTTPAAEMTCGEGQGLRFFAPHELPVIDIAYNHRDVLIDFFGSPLYWPYLRGVPFGADGDEPRQEALATFRSAIRAGDAWFDALMRAVAGWERPRETVDGRSYHYLVGDEAFDWLLLAERLVEEAGDAVPVEQAERLLFAGAAPMPMDDERLRDLIGPSKHRAHLNYLYGVTVEDALQYATELDVLKERAGVRVHDARDEERAALADPVFYRIYGKARASLLREFRIERRLPQSAHLSLGELREFTYWLFKYRVKHTEPARVASDTRRALAQLSAMEDSARRRRRALRPEAEHA